MKRVITMSLIMLIILATVGCKKEKAIYPEAVIIKELPVMYGAISEHGTVQLIQSQQELNKLFNGDAPTFPEELTNIDFEKSSLIIGSRGYGRGIAELKHTFIRKQNNHYEYLLAIEYDLTLPVGLFSFGIIVNKLPNGANIELEVKEINH